jgi:Kef-type K+ transport system membrane component KefB
MSSFFKANLLLLSFCIFPFFASASGQAEGNNLIEHVGIAIFASAVLGYLAHRLKQPLLLAYLITGVIIGPVMGFGFISEESQVETISH